MSIKGLYDSEKGDSLARKSMLCFKRPEDGRFHKERFCACGGLLPHLPKHRDGNAVCDMCAEVITKRKRNARVEKVAERTVTCTVCGKAVSPRSVVVRNGKKCCKDCGAGEHTMFAHTYACGKCGTFKPVRFMVRRNGEFYCKECGDAIPSGRDARTHECSVCKIPKARVFLKQYHGELFCQKCYDNK